MENKRYYWLKLKDDFFDEKYVKAIRKLPSGDSLLIVYLKMQLSCLKTNGFIKYDRAADNMEEELALMLDEDLNIVKLTLSALSRFGLIERENDESICVIGMTTDLIGSESSVTERVRKHREKKKVEAQLLQCNITETKCNTDIDIDINIDKKLDIEIEEELDLEKVIENIKSIGLLTEDELKHNAYEAKLKQYSNHLTYGYIQNIAVYILQRLPNYLINRYMFFESSFDNKVKEKLKNDG